MTCCLQGGHVIDAKNGISALMDVGIKDGKIAAVAAKLDPKDALKTVNVGGLYVTPGLIDIHVHVYSGTGERNSYAGDNSVPPDGFTFRVGRDHRRRRGLRRVAQLRGFQGEDYRPLEDPRAGVPQHRRERHARRTLRKRSGGHGARAGRRDGEEAQGPDRRIQVRALHRQGMDAGGERGRGGQLGEHSGDGGLRQRPSGAAAGRPA